MGPYDTFDGYYDWGVGAVYAPGYLETDTVVHVVSNLYSLDQNKLVWSGTSKTFDPASANQFMTDVARRSPSRCRRIASSSDATASARTRNV